MHRTDFQEENRTVPAAESTDKSGRRYDLDWIRVLVILNLVPWHAAWLIAFVRGFSDSTREGFGITILRYYTGFSLRWQIPLLFFIAGASACLSLSHRSPGAFVRERARRLFVPLMFFMLVCYPALLYFWPGVWDNKSLSDYLVRFWPHCLATIHRSRMPGRIPMPGWAHLWFVAYLLIFSLISLPLFICLIRQGESGIAGKYVSFFTNRGAILLLAVPLMAINMILSPKWPMAQLNLYDDWTYFCYDLTVFIYGYVICLHDRLSKAVDRHLRISLLLAIVSTVFVLMMRFEMPSFSRPAYTPRYMLYSVFLGLHTWCWILAVLALAKKFLSGTNRFLKYASRASYPFYILHFVLMLIIGYYVMQWHLVLTAEFAILSVLTFAATLGSYELLVKRTKVTRFLFGMKV
jgi:peptidoglycan/LPS O-acetylase OafA/YrhL